MRFETTVRRRDGRSRADARERPALRREDAPLLLLPSLDQRRREFMNRSCGRRFVGEMIVVRNDWANSTHRKKTEIVDKNNFGKKPQRPQDRAIQVAPRRLAPRS